MSSIQSLLGNKEDSIPDNQQDIKKEYEFYSAKTTEVPEERIPAITIKNHSGGPNKFGERKYPKCTKLNFNDTPAFHVKRYQPGRTQPRAKFSREPKRGFRVDKTFKPRRWLLKDSEVPLNTGFCLKTKVYRPISYRNLPDIKYSIVGNKSNQYKVSIMSSRPSVPRIQATPLPPQPYPKMAFYQPVQQPQLQPIQPIGVPVPPVTTGKSKARILCTVPNCNKDFSDRSSLNRHKKRFHPELFANRIVQLPNQ